MLFELKKAIQSLNKPGVSAHPVKLAAHAVPYYFPVVAPPYPLTIYWSINSVCNLRCKMCDVGTFNEEGTFFKNLRITRKLHEIDIEVFKRVVDEVAPNRPFMAINSTEPLMYKPLGEAIAYCVASNLGVGVTTGGYTLPERADELARAGLSRLNISIDGPPETHNFIRGRNDSFEKSCEGLRQFKEVSKEVGLENTVSLNYTITNLNYDKLIEFYEEVRDWPVDQINFTYMWFIDPGTAADQNRLFGDRYPVTSSCYGDEIDPRDVDVDLLSQQLEYLKNRHRVHIAPPFNTAQLKRYFHEPSRFMSKGAKCMATWFFLQVLADGSVIVYTRCHSTPLGNINEQSIGEIWRSETMEAWREFIRKERTMPMCKRCDLAY